MKLYTLMLRTTDDTVCILGTFDSKADAETVADSIGWRREIGRPYPRWNGPESDYVYIQEHELNRVSKAFYSDLLRELET